jgi:L-threonylcarbamoyladenylate synthase
MQMIKINPHQPDHKKIEKIVMVLKEGGVIIYPTDTLYGLGANIYDEKAVQRIYEIKNRHIDKPISICLPRIDDVDKVAYLDDRARDFLSKILPGPFTILLHKKKEISALITKTEKIGIRIPDLTLCQEISSEFPITTTSANISGHSTLHSIEDISLQLGDVVDLVVDGGLLEKHHSTVLDLTAWPPKINRKGLGMNKLSRVNINLN